MPTYDLDLPPFHVDSYANIITGLLQSQTDPNMHTVRVVDRWLCAGELNALYVESAVASRVVDRLVDDALNARWVPKASGDYDWSSIRSRAEDLDVANLYGEAWKWGRLHGGGALLIDADDGGPSSEPLIFSRIKRIRGFAPVDAQMLLASAYDRELGTAGMYRPARYSFQQATEAGHKAGEEIHSSRVIRFDAVKVPPSLLNETATGWGPSVLQRCHKSIRSLDVAYDNADAILHKISVLAVKIKGWRKMIEGVDGVAKGRQLLSNLMAGVSNLRMLGLDTEDELVEITRSLEGVGLMIDKAEQRMVRDSGQPRHVITGEPPPGALGDSGSAVERDWQKQVNSARRDILTPGWVRVINLLLAERRDEQAAPGTFTIEWESLEEPDRRSEAEVDLLEAQTDGALVLNQIAAPDELRKRWIDAGRVVPVEEIGPDVDLSEIDPAALGGDDAVSDQALTGIQLSSLVSLVQQVSVGALAPSAARLIVQIGFPSVSPAVAASLIASAGEAPNPTAPEIAGATPVGAPAPAAPTVGPSTDEAPADLVSVREAAAKFGLKTRTLTRLMETGALAYWGFGAHRQVSLSDVLAAGKAHEQPDEPDDEGAGEGAGA